VARAAPRGLRRADTVVVGRTAWRRVDRLERAERVEEADAGAVAAARTERRAVRFVVVDALAVADLTALDPLDLTVLDPLLFLIPLVSSGRAAAPESV
jgi:hypothetical protein